MTNPLGQLTQIIASAGNLTQITDPSLRVDHPDLAGDELIDPRVHGAAAAAAAAAQPPPSPPSQQQLLLSPAQGAAQPRRPHQRRGDHGAAARTKHEYGDAFGSSSGDRDHDHDHDRHGRDNSSSSPSPDKTLARSYTSIGSPDEDLRPFPSPDERFRSALDAKNRMISYAFYQGFQVRVRSSNDTTVYFVCACEGHESSSRKKGSAKLTPEIVPRHKRTDFERAEEVKPRQRSGKTKRCGCGWRAKAVSDRSGDYLYFPADDGYRVLTHNHPLRPDKPTAFPQHRRKIEDRELEALVENTSSGNLDHVEPRDIRRAIKVLERRKTDAAKKIDEYGKEIDKLSSMIDESSSKVEDLEAKLKMLNGTSSSHLNFASGVSIVGGIPGLNMIS